MDGRRGLKGKGLLGVGAADMDVGSSGRNITSGWIWNPNMQTTVSQQYKTAYQASCQMSLQAQTNCAHRRNLQDSRTESRA
jgi:hypothetical protein